MTNPIIVWFKNDLRLQDNPAVNYAIQTKKPIIPLFIWSPEEEAPWQPGAASKLWLKHSLTALNQVLVEQGSRLIIKQGNSLEILQELIKLSGADEIVWNRRYEPKLKARDESIVNALVIAHKICNGALILNLEQIKNKQGQPFKVFTPFYNHCLGFLEEYVQQEYPKQLSNELKLNDQFDLNKLGSNDDITEDLLEAPDHWQKKMLPYISAGEQAALRSLKTFSKYAADYNEQRDRPDITGTSKLSTHLHFGEISPYRVWKEIKAEPYRRQLIWREFAYYIMHHYPYSTDNNFKAEFDKFPWRKNIAQLKLWQQGQTGYPLVDAGMRELWETGWMHNRVRMIVGSFLVKDLLIDWREGAKWFWDTLFDADLANNSMGWQWVAGSGVDASPFFRIFNPITQAEKFDPHKKYIRKWIPELETNYARPMVNHDAARKEALAAVKQLSAKA